MVVLGESAGAMVGYQKLAMKPMATIKANSRRLLEGAGPQLANSRGDVSESLQIQRQEELF